MTNSTRFSRRFTLLAALLLAVAGTLPAQAQNDGLALADGAPYATVSVAAMLTVSPAAAPSFSVSDVWIDNIDQQFAQALHASIDDVRARTLKNIIYVATFHEGLVSLKAAVPSLVDVYRFDDVEAHRLMAVQALAAIGDGYRMQRLREEGLRQPSARVRAATEAALIENASKN